jgi:hypothetical protein
VSGLCLSLTLAGCGQASKVPAGGQQPEAAAAIPENQAVSWAEGYCGSVSELVRSLSTMPAIDPSTPQRATRTSSALLAAVISGLDSTLAGLGGLGPSPIAGGDQVRRDAVAEFTAIRDSAAEAKKQVDTPSSDPAKIKQALAGASAQLDKISKIKFLAGLDSVPALSAAARLAPTCSQLAPTP